MEYSEYRFLHNTSSEWQWTLPMYQFLTIFKSKNRKPLSKWLQYLEWRNQGLFIKQTEVTRGDSLWFWERTGWEQWPLTFVNPGFQYFRLFSVLPGFPSVQAGSWVAWSHTTGMIGAFWSPFSSGDSSQVKWLKVQYLNSELELSLQTVQVFTFNELNIWS